MAAWVKGAPADTEAAIGAAAALLGGAHRAVIAGLCADLAGVRAAYRLADAIGASVDPVAGPSLYAELAALSTGGGMATTTAETLGRADAVLVLGARPWDGGLVAELAGSKPTRGRAAGAERTVLSLGGPGNGASRHVAYATGNAGLAAAIGEVRAVARGNLGDGSALADLAKRLAAALYGVVVYALHLSTFYNIVFGNS